MFQFYLDLYLYVSSIHTILSYNLFSWIVLVEWPPTPPIGGPKARNAIIYVSLSLSIYIYKCICYHIDGIHRYSLHVYIYVYIRNTYGYNVVIIKTTTVASQRFHPKCPLHPGSFPFKKTPELMHWLQRSVCCCEVKIIAPPELPQYTAMQLILGKSTSPPIGQLAVQHRNDDKIRALLGVDLSHLDWIIGMLCMNHGAWKPYVSEASVLQQH